MNLIDNGQTYKSIFAFTQISENHAERRNAFITILSEFLDEQIIKDKIAVAVDNEFFLTQSVRFHNVTLPCFVDFLLFSHSGKLSKFANVFVGSIVGKQFGRIMCGNLLTGYARDIKQSAVIAEQLLNLNLRHDDFEIDKPAGFRKILRDRSRIFSFRGNS